MSISHHPLINIVLVQSYLNTPMLLAFTMSSGNLCESSITLWLKIFATIQPYIFLLHFETISPSYSRWCLGEKLRTTHKLSKPWSILHVSNKSPRSRLGEELQGVWHFCVKLASERQPGSACTKPPLHTSLYWSQLIKSQCTGH